MSQRKTKQMLLSSWVESDVGTDTQGSSVASTDFLPATRTRKTSVITAVISKETSSDEVLEESNEIFTVSPTTVPTSMPSSDESGSSNKDFPEDNIQCSICCNPGNNKAWQIIFSPKRCHLFSEKLVQSEANHTGVSIKLLCPTRWTARSAAINAALKDYTVLIEAMEEINLTTRDEYGLKARGLLNSLQTFRILFGLSLSYVLFTRA